jgi:hypothetical protein
MGALDGISTYVVDLDASGRGRGVTRLQSGDEVYCSDVVAGSASVVNVAIELGAMPLMGSISLSGCPDPRAAVVRFALGESAPVPGGGVGLGAVQRGGLRLASDGEGGYLVGLASVGSGDANLGSGCGAGGPSYSIDVLRLDSGGARLWARRIVEVPEISDGALTLDVTRSGDRAVVLAALDAGGATSFRVLDAAGAEVSPAREAASGARLTPPRRRRRRAPPDRRWQPRVVRSRGSRARRRGVWSDAPRHALRCRLELLRHERTFGVPRRRRRAPTTHVPCRPVGPHQHERRR